MSIQSLEWYYMQLGNLFYNYLKDIVTEVLA